MVCRLLFSSRWYEEIINNQQIKFIENCGDDTNWYFHLESIGCNTSNISLSVFAVRPSILGPQWASYQIGKIAGCACAGNAGNVSPRRRFQRKPVVSDPGRDACRDRLPAVTGKTFPAFPAHAHPQFYVSGKRSMHDTASIITVTVADVSAVLLSSTNLFYAAGTQF